MKKKGFTMVELIAVMALMAVVGLVINSLFIYADKTFGLVRDTSYLQDEARIIFSTFESDIKMAKEYSNNLIVSGNSLIVKDKNGTEIANSPINISSLGGGSITPIGYVKLVKEVEGSLKNLEYVYLQRGGELIRAEVILNNLGNINIPSKNLQFISTNSNDKEVEINISLKSKKSNEEKFSTIITRRN